MNVSFFIACRYLISKKSHSAINIISWISVAGIAAGVGAMFIILSAINGMEGEIKRLFSSFDPDIKITSTNSKTFVWNDELKNKLENVDGIAGYAQTIEEICILRFRDKWMHATLKGVDSNFFKVSSLKNYLVDGAIMLQEDNVFYALSGGGIATRLGLYIPAMDEYLTVSVYVPVRNKKIKINSNPFNREGILLAGVFEINPEYDMKYFVVPLAFASKILEYNNHLSALEIKLKNSADENRVMHQLQNALGDNFEIKNRYQQKETIFKVSRAEKWFTFSVLCFVLVLMSFNIISSLAMLILDKKEELPVLQSMGATKEMITRIYFNAGLMINLLGFGIGILLGLIICLVQINFHLITMEGATISYYPIEIKAYDVFVIFIALSLIATLFSILPSWLMIKKI